MIPFLSLLFTYILETTIKFLFVTRDAELFGGRNVTNVRVGSFNDHGCVSFVSLFCSCKPYIRGGSLG